MKNLVINELESQLTIFFICAHLLFFFLFFFLGKQSRNTLYLIIIFNLYCLQISFEDYLTRLVVEFIRK